MKNRKVKWESWCLKFDIPSTWMVPEWSRWPIAAIHQPGTSAISHNSTKLAIRSQCQPTHTPCTQQRKMRRLRMILETPRSKSSAAIHSDLSEAFWTHDHDDDYLIANYSNFSEWMRCHSRIIPRTLRYGDPSSHFHLSCISACLVEISVSYWYLLQCHWITFLSTRQRSNLACITPL